MKIESTRLFGSGQLRRVGGKGNGEAKPRFVVGEAAEEALAVGAPIEAGAAFGVSAIGTLLAAQEVGDPLSGRSKDLARGGRLLDRLDEIRMGLLAGGIPKAALLRLQREVEAERQRDLEPRLRGILDEIELRARVELAKYEQDA